MKTSKKFLIAAAALMAVPLSSQAASTIIFNDTFESGTGDWYRAWTGGSTSLTTDSDRLSFTFGDTGAQEVIGRSFDAQTIPVGGSLTVTFDFRQTSATGIFRVGFYDLSTAITQNGWAQTNDGSFAGYTTFIRSSTSNVARQENGPFNTTVSQAYPTVGATAGGVTVNPITTSGGSTFHTFQDNTDYQFSFTIDRVSATQMDTRLIVMEGAIERFNVVGSQTSGTQFTDFNTLVLRTSSGTALYDNIEVTFIPEPSTALLGGLGMLCLLRRRR